MLVYCSFIVPDFRMTCFFYVTEFTFLSRAVIAYKRLLHSFRSDAVSGHIIARPWLPAWRLHTVCSSHANEVLAFVDRREIDLVLFIKAQHRRDFASVWPTDRSNYLNYSSENKRTTSTSRGNIRIRYRLMHCTSFDSGWTSGCFADFGFESFVNWRPHVSWKREWEIFCAQCTWILKKLLPFGGHADFIHLSFWLEQHVVDECGA
jgi:hypothetical protein